MRVPGRFEPVDRGQDFAVLVDYAHTPDSLRERAAGGARARRDRAGRRRAGAVRVRRGRRPRSRQAAADGRRSPPRLADLTLVTSDNPRSEDPEAIIHEILAGIPRGCCRGGHAVEAVIDRRRAIGAAVGEARPGDVVVIAGKGHEQGQEFAGGRKIPFDDVSVAREALDARLAAGSRAL